MALVWLEGFDASGNSDSTMRDFLYKLYPSQTAKNNLGFSEIGRHDGRAYRCSGASNALIMPCPALQTFTIGFAFKATIWTAGSVVLYFQESSTNQIDIRLVAGGEMEVTRAGTQLAVTSGLGGIAGTWYYIELQATIDNGVSGSVELHIDGVNEASNLATDTQMSANSRIESIIFYPNTENFWYDDMYLFDDTGGVNDDFVGDIRVTTVYPDGNGDDSDFGLFPDGGETNYENVDDGETLDEDTTYVESGTSGHLDLYTFPNIDGAYDIAGVQICIDARKDEAGAQKLKLVSKLDVTESADSGQGVASSYSELRRTMDVDAEGNAWTHGNLDLSQFGIEVV